MEIKRTLQKILLLVKWRRLVDVDDIVFRRRSSGLIIFFLLKCKLIRLWGILDDELKISWIVPYFLLYFYLYSLFWKDHNFFFQSLDLYYILTDISFTVVIDRHILSSFINTKTSKTLKKQAKKEFKITIFLHMNSKRAVLNLINICLYMMDDTKTNGTWIVLCFNLSL